MDDALGRHSASLKGIRVTGMVGVLLAAKQARLVKSIAPFREALARSDFRLSESLIAAALNEAGES